ncbi:efflux RND transporter permease subunit [Paenibacillus filicis]|uniref:Efflux RND transporter permease subunit n=1 Tax=Paenibacillus gyeongsangnamensis TaxID=3388067 RepID=A0ABT4QIC5_9BACL|nr:efflux RND transporter permease subunit [Paenibacillus filicis]MCZ8516583.1 efflux RND transporter permease subunit [Paenibacillus filicis]
MQRVIEAAMKRSMIVVVSILLILGWGGISAYKMERDYLPPINNSTLMISVRADNYQADQVKASLAGVMEQAIRNINGLESLEINSFNGGLLCSLYFPFRYDMEKAEGEVAQALTGLTLPSGVQKPLVTRVSTSSFPIMRLSVASQSDQADENALRTSLQNEVASPLKSVPGVGDIRITGGGDNGFVVTLRMKDLEKTGFTLDDVKRSLVSPGTVWPQGKIITDHLSIPIRVTGPGASAQDVNETLIHGTNGKTIPLSAVADVSASMVDLQTVSRTNGKPSVILDVIKNPSSNIIDVSNRVHERIQELQRVLPKDIQLSVSFDRAEDVRASLKGLIREGLLGCLFSMLSVLLFLRNIRATLLIALSLPICLLTTTALLKWMGISLNILTVSGLVVAMGRVVDDSIVILDNMVRKIQGSDRKVHLQLLSGAVRELMPAIVSSTATTIVVFIPIILVGGIVQASFSAFAWTVVIALIVSLFVSLFVVPAFAHLCWREFRVNSHTTQPFANRMLRWAFSRRKWVMALTLVIFAGTTAEAFVLPVNFLPTSGPGEISIKAALPEGSSLKAVDSEVKRVEDLLKSNSQIETFTSTIGSSFMPQFDDVFDDGGGWIQSTTEANLTVKVKANVNVDTVVTELRNQLWALQSAAKYTVTNRNISGDDSQLKVIFTGADAEALDSIARKARNILKLVSGLSVEGIENDEGSGTSYHLVLNQDQIKRSGIKVEDIVNRIQPYLSQGTRLDASVGGQPIPLILNTDLDSTAKQSGKDVLSLLANETFESKDGQSFSLQQLTSIAPNHGLSVYRDRDGHPFSVVTANIVTQDVEKVTNQVRTVMNGLNLPKGVSYSFGGISGQVQQMIMEMAISLSISVVLVLLIVSSVFRGWTAPLSVLVCIPLSLIGSVWGMVLFGKQWNLAAFIGVLMLIGIVVTNGIVLVDKIERNMSSGMIPEEAIIQGTLSRIRPVLMTAFATILTLLPLALSSRSDTVISQTLGIVVVGGMLSSTFISLILIPIIYKWMHKKSVVTSSDSSIAIMDGRVI